MQSKAKQTTNENRAALAGSVIGSVEPGCEIFCLTGGRFSYFDVILHCLGEIGPARCVVCAWIASVDVVDRLLALRESGRAISLRWIVDRSFMTVAPEILGHLTGVNGAKNVRSATIHAKMTLLWNDRFSLVLRTSANANKNPRVENFEISDDRALCDYMRGLCESVFEGESGEFGFTSKNEREKITNKMTTGELWQGKLSLNTTPLSLHV